MIRSGEWVEVRSKDEILATLDRNGRLDNLPFMPEMFQYCGKRYRVYKNAYKSCDTVSGKWIGLGADDCVHLTHRCDGSAHDGCQARCLIYWKTAWLRPLERPAAAPRTERASSISGARGCGMADIEKAVKTLRDGKAAWVCQATALLDYTRPLKWWDARQYIQAYTSGNKSIGEIVRGLAFLFYCYGTMARSRRLGAPARWVYNRFRFLWGGVSFPRLAGRLASAALAPAVTLGLKPGELVRVKSHEEILATVDATLSNRGLKFDAELVPYCGNVYRVKACIERFIDERDGKMRTLKTPAVILDGVVCKSRYSGKRLFCPREIYGWWREAWLERAEGAPDARRGPTATLS